MEARDVGQLVIVAGVIVVLVGLGIATGALSWFGHLPGDIRIDGENVKVYVPVVSMLIVSVLLSALVALGRRLF
jgi:hypothetical protein